MYQKEYQDRLDDELKVKRKTHKPRGKNGDTLGPVY